MSYCILGKIEKTDIYECIVCRHLKSTHKYAIYKYRRNWGGGGFRNTQHRLNCLLNCMVSSVGFPHPNSDFYEDLGERYMDCLTKINQSH